jgi:hypothetical protein
VIETLRTIDDSYPYFRGLVCELGFDYVTLPYRQPKRQRGLSKNRFYQLYDIGMLGLTGHSKVPLRVATILGFLLSLASFCLAVLYLIAKLLFWYRFPAGSAPILIGMFAFFSVQLFFTGLLGEYIIAILTQVQKRPLVVERERVNFKE